MKQREIIRTDKGILEEEEIRGILQEDQHTIETGLSLAIPILGHNLSLAIKMDFKEDLDLSLAIEIDFEEDLMPEDEQRIVINHGLLVTSLDA